MPPSLLHWKYQHHHLLNLSLLWGDPRWLNRQLLSWFSHVQCQQLLTGVPDIWHKHLNKSYRTWISTVTCEAAFNNCLSNRLLQQKTLPRPWAPSKFGILSQCNLLLWVVGSHSSLGLTQLLFPCLLHLGCGSKICRHSQPTPVFETIAGETLGELKGRVFCCRSSPQMETAQQVREYGEPDTDGYVPINLLAWANTSIICVGAIYTTLTL